jgi:hypothetical protein
MTAKFTREQARAAMAQVFAELPAAAEAVFAEPPSCTCFRDPHAFYCATVTRGLVPGYGDSADGRQDAADQARWDRK